MPTPNRDNLAYQLSTAIRAVLVSPEYEQRRTPNVQFEAKPHAERLSRFRKAGEALGVVDSETESAQRLFLVDRPSMWLRVMPHRASNLRFTIPQLRQGVRPSGRINGLPTFAVVPGDPLCVRNVDGFGTWEPSGNRQVAAGVAFAFTTGEIWMIDTRALDISSAGNFVPLNEHRWAGMLAKYTEFLCSLGLESPFRWIAGVDGVEGRGVYHRGEGGKGVRPIGQCATDEIVQEGLHSHTISPGRSLEPFFARIFDACGVAR